MGTRTRREQEGSFSANFEATLVFESQGANRTKVPSRMEVEGGNQNAGAGVSIVQLSRSLIPSNMRA
jgi:hypothetical protein